METSIETLEFSTAKLDSMLFEIPQGYTEAKSEEELQDKFDIGDMMKGMKNKAKNNENNNPVIPDEKQAGHIRVAVLPPTGDEQVNAAELQQGLVGVFTSGNVEAVAASSAEEAKSLKCDYLLNTQFSKIKQAGKVGSILKAIKNADPNAVSSYNIEANMTLTILADGSTKTQQKAEYTKNKAFDKKYYLDLILGFLKQHGSATRDEFDKLLFSKLPDWMNDKQKKNKVTNLLSELRIKEKIKNSVQGNDSRWFLF